MENESGTLIRRLATPLAEGNFWLKLVGVLLIVNGVLTALTIVGLLIAWLPIWMGVLLFQASGAISQARDQGDETAMIRGQQRLRTFFTISGVLTLIILVIWLVGMVFGIGGMMFGPGMGPGGGPHGGW
ncbi:DUF5362 domain-containing protein [Arhodomonas sp. SL1]|uniref:DUF5362 domain-containing protein n=1 Tax=Arhodomonas sp. SL1 TaxID=3425691 RepID=UPI003F8854AB